MKLTGKKLLVALVMGALVAGCDSGDIVISPSTVDNSVDNSTTTNAPTVTVNPCASYVNTGGQTIQGTFAAPDCTYSPAFVDVGNNLSTDLLIPALDDGGVHIFQGSLFVGESFDTDAELTAAGIAEGGDGPVLTIEAGATLAFSGETKFIQINRGSQIFAVGTANAPITFTSQSDVESMRAVADGGAPTLAYNAITEWGGMLISGFGITNACSYTGTRTFDANNEETADTLVLAAPCHVEAEGSEGASESHYGGGNNDDNSGRLEFVRVKHTGGQVVEGDDLNGIAFNAVGRSTTVRNLQVYSTYDDGIEMFGGAVDIENFVAVYVRDDSLDFDNGWVGAISNALVIQDQSTGAHCIESDGLGGYSGLDGPTRADFIARGLNTRARINNLTCIISTEAAADNTPHDAGTGWRIREGHFPTIVDTMIVVVGPESASTNYCLRIDNTETLQGAQDGNIVFDSVIFTCPERTNGGDPLPNATTVEAWAAANGAQFATAATNLDPTATSDTGLVLLEGTPSIYSVPFATMVVDGVAPTIAAPASHIGAVLQSDDWTVDWTYGIHPGLRAPDSEVGGGLWFE